MKIWNLLIRSPAFTFQWLNHQTQSNICNLFNKCIRFFSECVRAISFAELHSCRLGYSRSMACETCLHKFTYYHFITPHSLNAQDIQVLHPPLTLLIYNLSWQAIVRQVSSFLDGMLDFTLARQVLNRLSSGYLLFERPMLLTPSDIV